MEHEVSELGYDLTFSTEVQEFGVTEARDLKPNGSNIIVTEENKMEYIRLVCQMKMTGAIRKQLNAFLEGFYDIIPKRLISIFNEQELELLISGLPNIDIDDLKANSEYHKYQPTSLQVRVTLFLHFGHNNKLASSQCRSNGSGGRCARLTRQIGPSSCSLLREPQKFRCKDLPLWRA